MVIAVGNPFLLLRMEEQIVKGSAGKRGHCWSTFLKFCLSHETVEFSEKLPAAQREEYLEQLRKTIQVVNPDPVTLEQEQLKRQIEELEAKLQGRNFEMQNFPAIPQVPLTYIPNDRVQYLPESIQRPEEMVQQIQISRAQEPISSVQNYDTEAHGSQDPNQPLLNPNFQSPRHQVIGTPSNSQTECEVQGSFSEDESVRSPHSEYFSIPGELLFF